HGLTRAKQVRSKPVYKAQSVIITAKLSGSRLDLMSQNTNTHGLTDVRKCSPQWLDPRAKQVGSKLIYKAQSVLVTAKLSGSRLDLMSANANNHDLPTRKTTYGLSGARSKSARS
ncbi:MAG: hypothetical protein IIT57_00635, partial [Treponema sp.]|nr:hypothetical protein [Treponema sp.]